MGCKIQVKQKNASKKERKVSKYFDERKMKIQRKGFSKNEGPTEHGV